MKPTPSGFSCPRCGTRGFTWQGLVAHRCDACNRHAAPGAEGLRLERRKLTKQELYQAKQNWSAT